MSYQDIRFKVKCPYCGHKNKELIDPYDSQSGMRTALCDNENGGCDCYFAYTFNVSVEVKAYGISGQSPQEQSEQE